MQITEDLDAANRARWERCVVRHNAALRCFMALKSAGVLEK